MPTKKFKATEGLLNDTMRKQSGVIEKALLEAVMNAVDAGATEVEVNIEESIVTVKDNGGGLSEQDIEKYFEQFGKKDDDIEDKEFGKFRMGRGQIFNFGVNIWRSQDNVMVVSLDDSKVTVELPNVQDTDDSSVLDVNGDELVLNTEGLSYAWLKSNTHVEGTNIEIALYNVLEDVSDTVSEFKDLVKYIPWLHDVSVSVNGEQINNEPSVIEETELAFYCEGGSGVFSRSPVFNKGALVDKFGLGPREFEIITKNDLDVTLDRTDILETDETWQEIQEEYKEIVIEQLEEEDELGLSDRQWLIEVMTEDLRYVDRFQNMPILEDVTGDYWSITDVAERPISFGREGDKVAEQAMRQSMTVVLKDSYEKPLTNFVNAAQEFFENSQIKEYSEVVEQDTRWEMKEVNRDNLSKRRVTNLDKIQSFLDDLGFNLTVKAGNSKHQNVWKDGDGSIFIEEDYLNKKKGVIATEVVFNVVRIASHSGDTRGGTEDNISWKRSFKKHMEGDSFRAECDFPTAQQRMMNGYYD